MAKSLIAGNWKMHGTAASAAAIAGELAKRWNNQNSVEMIVFPAAIASTPVIGPVSSNEDIIKQSDFSKIKGNHTKAVFGSTYLSEYKFSTPYLRETSGNGTVALTSGRYQIRQVSIDYQNSGFFKATVTQEGRNNVDYEFNGTVINSSSAVIGQPNITSGTYNIPIQSRNTHYTCTLKSDSHLPVHFVSAELEGFYHRRSSRA